MPFAPPLNPDTTLPAATARLVWHGPALRSHALLALTASRLVLSPAGTTVTPDALAAARGPGDPAAALGPAATVIELASVRRVVADLAADILHLEADGAGRVTLAFGSAEAADAVFAAVWKRAGDGFDLTPYRPDGWATVREPVLAMLGVAAAMAGLGWLADYPAWEAGGLLDPLARAAGGVSGRVVYGFGGGVLAVLQVWLYRRLTAPPTRLELVRRGP